MGTCCSGPAQPHYPPASLSAVELPSYDPSATPFLLSIPEAIESFHSSFPPCSQSSLQQQRDEFWHTRVEGDQAVWLLLRRVCECDDAATRDVMLDSAGLQRWSIEKMEGVYTYDAKGFKYEVPFYCLCTPRSLITPEEEAEAAAAAAVSPPSFPSASSHLTTPDEIKAEPSVSSSNTASPQTGSRVLATDSPSAEKPVRFKIRFSDGIGDLPLCLSLSTPLSLLKARVREEKGISAERQVYFLHGKRLAAESTLRDIGIRKEMVLQCFVRQDNSSNG